MSDTPTYYWGQGFAAGDKDSHKQAYTAQVLDLQPMLYRRLVMMVNGKRVDTRDVVFKLEKDGQGTPFLAPCLTVSQLSRYGVKT
ncbi:hypothetical protein MJM99_33120, partial [Salmonella enterica subsp. enterica serovar Kentucky]|nr:hypothetical protein [Salmonella enterica subsp. enterica serovar Kentucky]